MERADDVRFRTITRNRRAILSEVGVEQPQLGTRRTRRHAFHPAGSMLVFVRYRMEGPLTLDQLRTLAQSVGRVDRHRLAEDRAAQDLRYSSPSTARVPHLDSGPAQSRDEELH